MKGRLWGRNTFLIDNLEFYMHFLLLVYISWDPVSIVLGVNLSTTCSMAGILANQQIQVIMGI